MMGPMFPLAFRSRHVLPLIAVLSFLAHIHYSKVARSMKWDRHVSMGAAARAR